VSSTAVADVADAGIKPRTGVASTTPYAGAAAFLLAAAWYALVVTEVVVAAEPRPQPGQSREEWLQTYFSHTGSRGHSCRESRALARGSPVGGVWTSGSGPVCGSVCM
jgi:hypothetical protein